MDVFDGENMDNVEYPFCGEMVMINCGEMVRLKGKVRWS